MEQTSSKNSFGLAKRVEPGRVDALSRSLYNEVLRGRDGRYDFQPSDYNYPPSQVIQKTKLQSRMHLNLLLVLVCCLRSAGSYRRRFELLHGFP